MLAEPHIVAVGDRVTELLTEPQTVTVGDMDVEELEERLPRSVVLIVAVPLTEAVGQDEGVPLSELLCVTVTVLELETVAEAETEAARLPVELREGVNETVVHAHAVALGDSVAVVLGDGEPVAQSEAALLAETLNDPLKLPDCVGKGLVDVDAVEQIDELMLCVALWVSETETVEQALIVVQPEEDGLRVLLWETQLLEE